VHSEIGAYAAALTYGLLLSLFPLSLGLAAAVPHLHLGRGQNGLAATLASVVPTEVFAVLRASAAQGHSPAVAAAGVLGYLTAMSGTVRRSLEALGRVYGAPRRRPWWRPWAAAVGLAAGGGFALLLALATIGWTATLGLPTPLTAVLRWWVVLLLAAILLGVLYAMADPAADRRIGLSPGAVTAIAVWLLSSYLLSLYFSHFRTYNRLYGSLGAVILLLLYLYLSAYAVLLGGVVNAVLRRRSL